ncbi:hypothetical protein J4526_05785 [Desulfurococcaceae archaeon MEX13E-LK6-19]|nr:hypothetical protein J4526_05785 [Desulfurococcaceae archaeon MEX13E-LK6-19]
MFRRRRDPEKVISSIIHRVKLAEMKLKVADNIRKENKGKPLNELVMVSALSGVPILPEFLERVYINAAINDFDRARRELVKFRKDYVDKMKYSVSMALIKEKIDEAINILSELKDKNIASADDVEQYVKKCTNSLQEALSVIEKHKQ